MNFEILMFESIGTHNSTIPSGVDPTLSHPIQDRRRKLLESDRLYDVRGQKNVVENRCIRLQNASGRPHLWRRIIGVTPPVEVAVPRDRLQVLQFLVAIVGRFVGDADRARVLALR